MGESRRFGTCSASSNSTTGRARSLPCKHPPAPCSLPPVLFSHRPAGGTVWMGELRPAAALREGWGMLCGAGRALPAALPAAPTPQPAPAGAAPAARPQPARSLSLVPCNGARPGFTRHLTPAPPLLPAASAWCHAMALASPATSLQRRPSSPATRRIWCRGARMCCPAARGSPIWCLLTPLLTPSSAASTPPPPRQAGPGGARMRAVPGAPAARAAALLSCRAWRLGCTPGALSLVCQSAL